MLQINWVIFQHFRCICRSSQGFAKSYISGQTGNDPSISRSYYKVFQKNISTLHLILYLFCIFFSINVFHYIPIFVHFVLSGHTTQPSSSHTYTRTFSYSTTSKDQYNYIDILTTTVTVICTPIQYFWRIIVICGYQYIFIEVSM